MTDFAFATVKAVGDQEGPGEFEAILSTGTLDRDGEVIGEKAFGELPASIPIYFEHDWKSGASPVGRGVPFYEGDTVKLKGRFASTPRAQEIRSLVVEGVVDSMSVGFLNGKREMKSSGPGAKAVKTVVSAEMFEGSLTAIPINTTAHVLAAKAMNEKAGARNSTTDSGRLQTIHDLAMENGATCDSSKAIGTKSIEGSIEALQDRVRDALEDQYGKWSTCLRGVLPDAVIFDQFGEGTMRQSYTDDGAVVTLEGNPVEVDIHEVVVPDPDADREPSPMSTLVVDDAAEATTKAAGSEPAAPVAAAAADAAEQAKARLSLLRAKG